MPVPEPVPEPPLPPRLCVIEVVGGAIVRTLVGGVVVTGTELLVTDRVGGGSTEVVVAVAI
jgi:hypothetical protein